MNPKSINILLSVIILILSGALLYSVKHDRPIPAPIILQTSPKTAEPVTKTPPKTEVAPTMKTYTDTSFSFEYPSSLTVQKTDNRVHVGHSIPYRTEGTDYCDFRGSSEETPVPVPTFSDFDANFSLINKDLKGAIEQENSYLLTDYFANNTLKVTDGFIEDITVGSLKGFMITQHVEGCGNLYYYFPISSTKTLFINRRYISQDERRTAEIHHTVLAKKEGTEATNISDVPGFLSKEQEDKLFLEILATLKVK